MTNHPSASESGELNLDHLEALTDEQYQEVLRPVLSRYGMQRFLNGDEITLNPSDYRAIIERARRAAPAPAPTAGDALPTLTIGEAFSAVGGWMNGGELGYPSFGSMNALAAYTQKMVCAALANQPAPTVPAIYYQAGRLSGTGNDWRFIDKAEYDRTHGDYRRMVFAHQPAQEQAEPVPDDVEFDHSEGGHHD